MKTLFAPLLDGRAKVIEVRQAIEDRTTNETHLRLRGSVFSGNCSSWYIGEFGRNAASWPGMAWEFWAATFFPDWSAFNMDGGSNTWFVNRLYRQAKRFAPAVTRGLILFTSALVGKQWLDGGSGALMELWKSVPRLVMS